MVVYKYPLRTTSTFEVEIPNLMTPLCIKEQDGVPTLWALVNPDIGTRKYKFWCVYTGEMLPPELTMRSPNAPKTLGTVIIGKMVYHYWYVDNTKRF